MGIDGLDRRPAGQRDDRVHAATLQVRHVVVAAEALVPEEDLAVFEHLPLLAEQRQLDTLLAADLEAQQTTGGQREAGADACRRKAASLLLLALLRPFGLVGRRVGHADARAVSHDHAPSAEEAAFRHGVEPLGGMLENVHQFGSFQFAAGLTVGRRG